MNNFFLRLLRDIIVALLFPFVRVWYQTIWALRDRISLKKSYILEQCYWKWCSHYGAWIGLGAKIDEAIVLPHDLNGIFISQYAKIGKGCTLLHQVTIGSNICMGGGSCFRKSHLCWRRCKNNRIY